MQKKLRTTSLQIGMALHAKKTDVKSLLIEVYPTSVMLCSYTGLVLRQVATGMLNWQRRTGHLPRGGSSTQKKAPSRFQWHPKLTACIIGPQHIDEIRTYFVPYGAYSPLKMAKMSSGEDIGKQPDQNVNYAKGKDKMATFGVSNHCVLDGFRFTFVRALMKHIPVSLYARGGSAPRFNPLPCHIPFWQKSYPFYIPFIEKRYPFHITTLGSLVLIFM